MKILFENGALSATRSSLFPNGNYPLENIAHPFLKKIYKSTADEDTVTLEWTSAKVVNCVYIAFTNAQSIEARLYNADAVLLKIVSLSASDLGSTFLAVAGVRRATFSFVAPTDEYLYVGSIGIGESYAMPDPIADWKDGGLDNSVKGRSKDGQVWISKVPTLRQFGANFKVFSFEEHQEIKALVFALSRPVFVDLFETAHSKMPPLYCDIDGGFANPTKGERQFTFSLTFVEAR
jgi:hypothetical protein